MENVLLAVGEPNLSSILRNKLKEYPDSFKVLQQEVLHHKYLYEILDGSQPDILIVHDKYLETDKQTNPLREQEWLSFSKSLRTKYDDSIRMVFLCEREKGDPFLSELVSHNVLDIFNNRSINSVKLIEQLKDKPKYSNVAGFKVESTIMEPPIEKEKDPVKTTYHNLVPDESSGKNDEKDPKQKRVVQKQIINKVVNKQVVKREFKINFTRKVEKVVGVPLERQLVLVGSPYPRSGSTFFAHLLAAVLVDLGIQTTYIESPYSNPYTYDRLSAHLIVPEYRSLFSKFIDNDRDHQKENFSWVQGGLSFVVKNPSIEPVYKPKDVGFDTFIKVIMASKTPVTIIDVGTDWDKEIYSDIYELANRVYMVIEPDIANLLRLEESTDPTPVFYRNKRDDKEKFQLVGNRFTEQVLKHEIIKDLCGDMVKTIIPPFSPEDTFNAQYNGGMLLENKKLCQTIEDSLKPVIDDLLPKEFLKNRNKGKKGLAGIFSR